MRRYVDDVDDHTTHVVRRDFIMYLLLLLLLDKINFAISQLPCLGFVSYSFRLEANARAECEWERNVVKITIDFVLSSK